MSESVPYFNAEDLAVTQAYYSELNLNPSTEYVLGKNASDKISWNSANKVAFNLDEGLAKLDLIIKGHTINNNGQDTGSSLGAGFHFFFQINNFEKYTFIKDGKTEIHSNLGTSILAVAYSTARGMLIEKTQNTIFKGWILPVVSPAKLMSTQQNHV